MSKQVVIHSQRMAGWLMYHGHKLILRTDNKIRAGYSIYIFNDTEQIQIDMKRYT